MYKIKTISSTLTVFATTFLLNAGVVFADHLENCDHESGEGCVEARVKEYGEFALALIGLFVLINFVIGAIMFITASGNPERIAKSKERVGKGIAALVMLALFVAISEWVLI